MPEHYCDFLLNLYMDDSVEASTKVMGISSKSIQNSHWKFWLLAFGIISLFFFVVLHFNSFPLPMQIGICSITVLICYIAGILYRDRNKVAGILGVGLGSILLLWFGLHFLLGQGYDEAWFAAAFIACCSVLWILLGVYVRLALLHFCGWIGLVFCYSWCITEYASDHTWIAGELYWVPAGLLFCWLSWLIHDRNKAVSGVFLANACLLWMMPQIYSYVMEQTFTDLSQGIGFVKLFAAGIILFFYRKKWTEWVA